MHRLIPLVLIALLVNGMSSSHAAVIVAVPAENDRKFGYWIDQFAHEELLGPVVRLLEQNERGKARALLSRIIRKNPNNGKVRELAGLVLLQDGESAKAEQSLLIALKLAPDRTTIRSKLGLALIQQNKYRDAMHEFETALRSDPKDSVAHRFMGWLRERQGQNPQAIAHYEAALTHQGSNKAAFHSMHVALGRLYNQIGRFQDTERLLTLQLSGTRPDGVPPVAHLLLAEAALVAQRTDEAGKRLAAAKDRGAESDPSYFTLLARLQASRGEIETARTTLENLAQRNPAIADVAYVNLATLYREKNATGPMIDALKKAVATAPDSRITRMLGDLTAALASNGRIDDAIDILKKEVENRPGQPVIRYVLAETLGLAKRPDEAIATLGALIADHPDFAAAHHLSGILHWRAERLDEAETALRRAIALTPESAGAWQTLASVAHSRSGDPAMLGTLREATTRNPNNPSLLQQYASLAYSEGSLPEAISGYRKLLTIDDRNPDVLAGLALALLDDDKETADVQRLLNRAREIDPEHAYTTDALGWMQLRQNKIEAAIETLERARHAAPQDGGIQYHLGKAYIAAGRTPPGTAALRRAIAHGVPKHYRADIVMQLSRRH